jgi:hypothetical protein
MLLEENPNAVNKHEASSFYPTPCELARKVLNVAARLSVRGKKHLSPQTELGVGLQPAELLPAARMSGALYPAVSKIAASTSIKRGFDINGDRPLFPSPPV